MVTFKRKPLEGVFPLTPFSIKENLEVDCDAIRGNIELLIENRFPGFIAFGTMGSHQAPSEGEFNKVTDVSIEAANGKIACVIGTTATNTKEVIRRVKYAEDAGADGTMILLPYLTPLSKEMVAKHWQMINDAIKGDLAIMIYNDPPTTRGFNHTAKFWEEYLLKMENIKALKEAALEPDETLLSIADKVNVFAQTDGQFWRLSMLGAKGIVAQLSWLAPKVILRWYEECRKRNWFDPWVLNVYKIISAPGYGYYSIRARMDQYPQALLHAMVDIGGGEGGEVSRPYLPLSENACKDLEELASKLRTLE